MHVGLKPHYFVIIAARVIPLIKGPKNLNPLNCHGVLSLFIIISFNIRNIPLVKMQFWIKTNDFQNFNIVNLNKYRKSDKQFTSPIL